MKINEKEGMAHLLKKSNLDLKKKTDTTWPQSYEKYNNLRSQTCNLFIGLGPGFEPTTPKSGVAEDDSHIGDVPPEVNTGLHGSTNPG